MGNVSIGTIFDTPISTKTAQNDSSNLGGLSCHWDSDQTVADRSKRCIAKYWDAVGGLFIPVPTTLPKLFITYLCIYSSREYMKIVSGYVCRLDNLSGISAAYSPTI